MFTETFVRVKRANSHRLFSQARRFSKMRVAKTVNFINDFLQKATEYYFRIPSWAGAKWKSLSVQTAIVSFHKRAVFAKWGLQKHCVLSMFFCKKLRSTILEPFVGRREMKIAHEAYKSFRWTYDFKSSVQTSRMSLKKIPWSTVLKMRGVVFLELWSSGVVFVLASKRLSKISPFWDYTN